MELASIRYTFAPTGSATHTEPPPTAIPEGAAPDGSSIDRCDWVMGSILITVPCTSFTTHTAPSPNATAREPVGTASGFARLLAGSIWVSSSPWNVVTHANPPPTAMPVGFPLRPPNPEPATFVLGSIRWMVRSR